MVLLDHYKGARVLKNMTTIFGVSVSIMLILTLVSCQPLAGQLPSGQSSEALMVFGEWTLDHVRTDDGKIINLEDMGVSNREVITNVKEATFLHFDKRGVGQLLEPFAKLGANGNMVSGFQYQSFSYSVDGNIIEFYFEKYERKYKSSFTLKKDSLEISNFYGRDRGDTYVFRGKFK